MPRFSALALAVALGLSAGVARAQPTAAAESLFQRGHELFEAKRYAEACPLFAESYRLDPVSGALLALASCHEAEGKLASAWAEYLEVAARAAREGRADRAAAAKERAAALEPRLARLAVSAGSELGATPGVVVRRDGVVVTAGFGVAVPVDPGEHSVEVTAPGRAPFSSRVSLREGETRLVAVPALAPLASEPPGARPPPADGRKLDEPKRPVESEGSPGSPLRAVGLVAAFAGVATAGVGGYFGLRAITKNRESLDSGNCRGNVCNAAGKVVREDALAAGNVSTVLFVVGGVLAGGGLVLVLTSGAPSSGKPSAALAPACSPDGAGASLRGTF
jgi:hypothetical protein